jgi:hypothetical protein
VPVVPVVRCQWHPCRASAQERPSAAIEARLKRLQRCAITADGRVLGGRHSCTQHAARLAAPSSSALVGGRRCCGWCCCRGCSRGTPQDGRRLEAHRAGRDSVYRCCSGHSFAAASGRLQSTQSATGGLRAEGSHWPLNITRRLLRERRRPRRSCQRCSVAA